jgi:predicted nuclease with RNAse H fold
MTAIGLDLAGLPSNPTGFASLLNRRFETGSVHTDEEIVELCLRSRPALVAIDAPLSLPARGNLRQADRLLIERGFRVFPPTFASMKGLTARGIHLARELRERSIRVIEIHPRTSGKILFGTTRRREWLSELRKKGWIVGRGMSEHEVDAVIAALTAWLHLRGKTEEVGAAAEGTIVIPCGPP